MFSKAISPQNTKSKIGNKWPSLTQVLGLTRNLTTKKKAAHAPSAEDQTKKMFSCFAMHATLPITHIVLVSIKSQTDTGSAWNAQKMELTQELQSPSAMYHHLCLDEERLERMLVFDEHASVCEQIIG